MTEIIKKYDDTYIFEEEGVRFFLLIGDDKAMMIDIGMNTPNALDLARPLTDKEIILVNTHADRDHISGNAAFEKVFMGVHEINHYLESGINNKIIPLYDKDIIDLGNRKVEVIDLPGHTTGSIALLDHKYGILFSGDSVQENGRIFMFGKERNMFIYNMTLPRLLDYEFNEIWPCHAKLPIGKEMIHSLINDSKKALLNELESSSAEVHGTRIRVLKGENNLFLVNE